MKRVNASKKYFFSREYFYQFLETIDSTLLLALYEGKIISGSLFTEYNGIVQTHLSATRNEYLYLSPLKYIWDCIRIMAKEKNRDFLHLGGGFGGKNDSLFGFKSQFSKQYFIFRTWRYVHNKAVYDQLLAETFKNEMPESSYFPLYRLNPSD
jgi:lipid II:glycine glycyltransferase (peptidoglycan interpeptide bridge formation enzyme)